MRLLSTHRTDDGEFTALVDRAGNVSITFDGLKPSAIIIPQEAREWAAEVLGGAVVLQFPVQRLVADVLGDVR